MNLADGKDKRTIKVNNMLTIPAVGIPSGKLPSFTIPAVNLSRDNASQPASATQAAAAASATDTYGLSQDMLQIIKSQDVRNISIQNLIQLTRLMRIDGKIDDYTASMAYGLQIDKGLGQKIDAAAYFNQEMDSVKQLQASGRIQFQPSALSGYQGAQQLMQKLAAWHDALQKDDRVQAAPEDGLQQALDSRLLTAWVSERLQGAAAEHGEKDWAAISRAMQAKGMALKPMDPGSTVAQRLDAAWQDYQQWAGQTRQPGIDTSA
nr:hypothetical protein [Chromobacterium sp. ASV5]